MKLGYLTYWCGWGCIATALYLIGVGIFTEEGFSTALIAKIFSGFFFGFGWLYVGSKQIAKHKSLNKDFGQLLKESQAQFATFQKENCIGCRFADEVAMRNCTAWNFQNWCLRPEPPEYSEDDRRCFSREQKQ